MTWSINHIVSAGYGQGAMFDTVYYHGTEVVAKDGLFRDPLGSVSDRLKVEFHQFWFCVGFWAPVNDCA